MSIDPTQNNSIPRLTTQATRPANRSTDTSPAAGNKTVDGSTEVHRSLGVDTSQDIDTVRVEEIRAGIADGSLTFDASRIADGLIASARDLSDGSSA